MGQRLLFLPGWLRQFVTFFWVGILSAVAHYSVLISMVELGSYSPVVGALSGYVCGGMISYGLNRHFTYESDRPHREATWRFVVVAGVGFVLTWGFMQLFSAHWLWPYLPAQIITTGIVLFWSFLAHKLWTFRPPAPPVL